jgi:hypothetical protein
MLKSKGHVIRLNVMDNQASQTIKNFLTKNQCKLMLVEPHSHHINTAERAIQTIKDHFMSALATTDAISHSSCGTDLPCKSKMH